jgi:uncharacterized protein YjbJ (UPF0337 family)
MCITTVRQREGCGRAHRPATERPTPEHAACPIGHITCSFHARGSARARFGGGRIDFTVEDARVTDYDRDKDLRARGVENQVEGSLKETEGKIRGAAADAMDDESEELKAKAKELEGKTQKNFGKLQENLDDAV